METIRCDTWTVQKKKAGDRNGGRTDSNDERLNIASFKSAHS